MKEILVLIIIFKLWGIGIELKFLEVVVHLLVPFISFHLKSLEFTFIKCTVRPGYIFIIPTVKRLRQEDFVHLRPPCAIYSQFWAWWGYVGTPYLNKTKNKLLFLNHHLTVKGCKELQFCIKKLSKSFLRYRVLAFLFHCISYLFLFLWFFSAMEVRELSLLFSVFCLRPSCKTHQHRVCSVWVVCAGEEIITCQKFMQWLMKS